MAPHVLRRPSLVAPLVLAVLAGCHDDTTSPSKRPTVHLAQGVGGVWTVNTLADAGDGLCDDAECTLREAIASAPSGDRIVFASGLQGDVDLTSGPLRIRDKKLEIDGAGRIELDAQGSDRVLLVAPDQGLPTGVKLARLTLKNGFEGLVSGAGLRVEFAEATLDSVVLVNNVTNGDGGGIMMVGSNVTIRNSTIVGNSAKLGGAIRLESGALLVTASTISGNVAVDGGALWAAAGTATFVRSTISGNTATPGSSGLSGTGGIENSGATVELRSSTLTRNVGSYTGGISNDETMSLANSIVAGNIGNAVHDCAGSANIGSLGHNILSNGCAAGPSDQKVTPAQVFTEVLEQDLKDNGGPTKTHAVLARGRAVDAGYCPGETTDQRGFIRPVDVALVPNATDGCDIGAYEAQGPVVARADLMVSQTVDKTSVKQGDLLTYSVRVRNLGPDTAPNVVLSDVLSSGVTFVEARVNKGSITAPPKGETGTVTWTLGDMLNQANEVADIKVTVLVRGKTTITNTASVTGDVADPNAANNSAAITVSVAAGSSGKK